MFEHLTLFGTYGAVRNLLLSRSEDKERNLTMGELLLAGAFSGLGTGVILTRALASCCTRARARARDWRCPQPRYRPPSAPASNSLTGFCSASVNPFALSFSAPELIKCRVQVTNASATHPSQMTTGMREVRAELAASGPRGLFVGLQGCLYREIPGNIGETLG